MCIIEKRAECFLSLHRNLIPSNRRFLHKGYFKNKTIRYLREGRMEAEILASVTQVNCKHEKQLKYTERIFDILNGFEIITIKCSNCHKTLKLTVKRMNS